MNEPVLDATAGLDPMGETPAVNPPAVEISNAVSRVHKRCVGRGPDNARTIIDHNVVVCLLEGGYTRAERTLEANDNVEVVEAARQALQDAMRDELVAAVEETLGRHVQSFMSASDPGSDLQVQVFVLQPREPA